VAIFVRDRVLLQVLHIDLQQLSGGHGENLFVSALLGKQLQRDLVFLVRSVLHNDGGLKRAVDAPHA
jgi:hypothetical protein